MIKLKELSLLPLSKGDKDFYFKIYSNPSLMHYVTTPLTRKESDKSFDLTLKRMSQVPPKILLNVMVLNKTAEKIGVIGLRWNQRTTSSVEIGIILLEKFHGTGLAHAAKQALIRAAFDNYDIKKIIAICEKNNKAANKANQKLGFIKVAQFADEKSLIVRTRWEITNEKKG